MLLNPDVELTDLYIYLDRWLDCWSPRRRQEGVGHDRNSSLISLCNSGTPQLVQSGSVTARPRLGGVWRAPHGVCGDKRR
jgi:hypothetical protein